MNFPDVLKALNQASAFELYRMRAGIDRVLDEPRWLLAIQSRLRIGESVEYFDSSRGANYRDQSVSEAGLWRSRSDIVG